MIKYVFDLYERGSDIRNKTICVHDLIQQKPSFGDKTYETSMFFSAGSNDRGTNKNIFLIITECLPFHDCSVYPPKI